MDLTRLMGVFIIVAFVNYYCVEATRINFEKCNATGFTCETSKEFSNKVNVIFQCNTTLTGQNVTIYLWDFKAPSNITSFTIQNCERVRLSFICDYNNKPIRWLKVENVHHLEIIPAQLVQNPSKITLENITYLDTIPRHTFSQVMKLSYKPNFLRTVNDLDEIFFNNVNIGSIETEAFWNLTNMKNFSWYNVSVYRTNTNAIELTFIDGSSGHLHGCNLHLLEPMAFRITSEKFYVTHGRFGNIWASALNGTISIFVFNNNSVASIQSGAISILAKRVYMSDNYFQTVESGAFQNIGPGLLRDSRMNFGNLRFVYRFTNNFIKSVENGGIQPDIAAYKNVASDVTYAYNIMQVFMRSPSHEHQQKLNVAWN